MNPRHCVHHNLVKKMTSILNKPPGTKNSHTSKMIYLGLKGQLMLKRLLPQKENRSKFIKIKEQKINQ